MAEIRTNRRRDPKEEYRDYPDAVQQYHRYDIYLDELPEDPYARKKFAEFRSMKQLIILARMNEEEYDALLKSLANHVIQKRIEVSKQRQKLMSLASELPDGKIYTYCVEEVSDDLNVPLAVFESGELDQARDFAQSAFIENRHPVQIIEGLFDEEGNMLTDRKLCFVIDVYEEE